MKARPAAEAEKLIDKNRIYAAQELNVKQNLKHCKQLRKLYLQAEKVKNSNFFSKQLTKTLLRRFCQNEVIMQRT
jgi:hypothetical protein